MSYEPRHSLRLIRVPDGCCRWECSKCGERAGIEKQLRGKPCAGKQKPAE